MSTSIEAMQRQGLVQPFLQTAGGRLVGLFSSSSLFMGFMLPSAT